MIILSNQHGGNIYQYQKPMVDFSANINPLGIPQGVQQAINAAIGQCVHYPDSQCRALTQALAGYLDIPPQWIIFGNGAADVIFRFVYGQRPKTALLLAPTFSEYEQALQQVDCRIAYLPLQENQDFQLTETILPLLRQQQPEVLFLCNPNNPTGQVIESELLREIADICQQQQTILFLDECFNDFLEERQRYTALPWLEQYDHLVILRAFTKFYALPGLRLGYGLSANPELLAKIEDSGQSWSVSVLAQAAGIVCLQQEEYSRESRLLIRQQRKILREGLQRLGYGLVTGEANYLFFKGESDLEQRLLSQGIMIRSCANYRQLGQGYYRIAVRLPEENRLLLKALAQLRKDRG